MLNSCAIMGSNSCQVKILLLLATVNMLNFHFGVSAFQSIF
jgi:hypothetical protein